MHLYAQTLSLGKMFPTFRQRGEEISFLDEHKPCHCYLKGLMSHLAPKMVAPSTGVVMEVKNGIQKRSNCKQRQLGRRFTDTQPLHGTGAMYTARRGKERNGGGGGTVGALRTDRHA
jgi:hypothetical protein